MNIQDILSDLSILLYIHNLIMNFSNLMIIIGVTYFTLVFFAILVQSSKVVERDTIDDFKHSYKIFYQTQKNKLKLFLAIFVLVLFLPTKTTIVMYYLSKIEAPQKVVKIVEKINKISDK